MESRWVSEFVPVLTPATPIPEYVPGRVTPQSRIPPAIAAPAAPAPKALPAIPLQDVPGDGNNNKGASMAAPPPPQSSQSLLRGKSTSSLDPEKSPRDSECHSEPLQDQPKVLLHVFWFSENNTYKYLFPPSSAPAQECPPSPTASNCSTGTSLALPDPDEPLDNQVVLDAEANRQYVWNSRTVTSMFSI